MTMAPPRCLQELNDDLLTQILIHVGPDEPARLFRASLTCKRWHRIISDPGFHRRYRAFHRCPHPLLGFFYNLDSPGPFSRFVATTPEAFTSPLRGFNDRRVSWALDCRHGHILFKKPGSSRGLVVWDAIADVWTDLPPPGICYESYAAVVLCGVAGCDHRDCHGGHFIVICIGCAHRPAIATAYVCIYSSEDAAWGAPVFDGTRAGGPFNVKQPAIIGDGIYCFIGGYYRSILKYDLVQRRFSWINMPNRLYKSKRDPVLLQNEDGSLGLAGVRGSTLYLWSMTWDEEEGGVSGWEQWMVIKLRKMLPVHDKPCIRANVIGFAEGVGVFFISTNVGVFTVELNTWQVTKVCNATNNFRTAFPFISTFTPGPDCA